MVLGSETRLHSNAFHTDRDFDRHVVDDSTDTVLPGAGRRKPTAAPDGAPNPVVSVDSAESQGISASSTPRRISDPECRRQDRVREPPWSRAGSGPDRALQHHLIDFQLGGAMTSPPPHTRAAFRATCRSIRQRVIARFVGHDARTRRPATTTIPAPSPSSTKAPHFSIIPTDRHRGYSYAPITQPTGWTKRPGDGPRRIRPSASRTPRIFSMRE
jgi:hypothetical protein